MGKMFILAGVALAAALSTGCADDYHRDRGPVAASYSYGDPDVWYDGFYGPYNGGYWEGDDFYYGDGHGGFVHDSGGHFRHTNFNGAHGFHSVPHPH